MQSALIIEAIKFATEKHKGQKRKASGVDYISHPIAASYLLPMYKKSKNLVYLIVALILHDVVEDTDTSIEEIYQRFGKLVGDLVSELTSDPEEIKRVGKKEYIKSKMLSLSSYGLVLKLIDRLSNILDNPTEKYVKDTIDTILYIQKERKKLSRTHRLIMGDILIECYNNQCSA